MKKFFLLLVLIELFPHQITFSQYRTDKKLESKLRLLVDSFHGTAGIYVRNLKTGKEVAINADTIFPTASIVKLPILIGIFNKIQQGVLHVSSAGVLSGFNGSRRLWSYAVF